MNAQLEMLPEVLDACCGGRMFWFNEADPRALYVDNRQESHRMDLGTPGTDGRSDYVVAPDVQATFTALPFPAASFGLVVFDPPHLLEHRTNAGSTFCKKYGSLKKGWSEQLRAGFAECFRVLKPSGILIFKWADTNVGVTRILRLTPEKPLFGTRRGRHTHWVVFMKSPSTVPAEPST